MCSYLAISPIDNGLIRLGNNAYGGIAYRAGAFEEMAAGCGEDGIELGFGGTRDPTRRFLTEYNLAHFWRRPGILPSTVGLPLPLLDTRSVPDQSGLYNRPPGNIRYDCPPIRYRGRNLLAGQFLQEDEKTIRLWAVNDFSDHKMLLQYDLRIKEREDDEAVESGDGRSHKFILLKAAKDGPKRMKLKDAAHQLRAMDNDEEGRCVFVRTKCSLELAGIGFEEEGPVEEAASSSTIIFKSTAVRSFVQIPHMEDEIAIVDGRGQLHWGRMGDSNSFSRATKSNNQILEVSPTDCPRILLSLGEQELRQIDLREPPGAAPGHLIYHQAVLDESNGPFDQQICNQISARDKFWHLATPDINLETAMVTTTRQHVLLDRRMPGIVLLAMDHAEMDGADYCLTVPAFTDPESGSRIFSHYALTHVRRPALSHWSFAYHPKEALWSSLGPKYELDSPKTLITSLYRPQIQSIGFDPANLPHYTRAIHYQPLHPNLPTSSTHALLIRQMEGGEIWYENVFFDPLPKLRLDAALEETGYEGDYGMEPIAEDAFRDKCLARIRHFHQSKGEDEAFYNDIDKKFLVEPKFQKISALELFKNDEALSKKGSTSKCTNPLADIYKITQPKVTFNNEEDENNKDQLNAKIAGVNDDKLLSKCVNEIWEKTITLCEERSKYQMNKIVERHIGDDKLGPGSLADDGEEMEEDRETGSLLIDDEEFEFMEF